MSGSRKTILEKRGEGRNSLGFSFPCFFYSEVGDEALPRSHLFSARKEREQRQEQQQLARARSPMSSSSSSSASAASWPSWPKSTRGTSLLDVLLFKDGSIVVESDGIRTKNGNDSSPSASSSTSTTVDLLFDDLFGEKSPFQVRRWLLLDVS